MPHSLAQAVENLGYTVTGTEGPAVVTFEGSGIPEAQLDIYEEISPDELATLQNNLEENVALGMAVRAILLRTGYYPLLSQAAGCAGIAIAPNNRLVFYFSGVTNGE